MCRLSSKARPSSTARMTWLGRWDNRRPEMRPLVSGARPATGSAVKSRKASRHWGSRAPVVDVYVASARKLRQVEKAVPMFCQVEVHR